MTVQNPNSEEDEVVIMEQKERKSPDKETKSIKAGSGKPKPTKYQRAAEKNLAVSSADSLLSQPHEPASLRCFSCLCTDIFGSHWR